MRLHRIRLLLAGLLIACTLARGYAAPDPPAETFDRLTEKAQKDPAGMSADEMSRVLQLGMELGRPYPASMAARSYLSQNRTVPPSVMLLAADTARMAGDFRSAATRYKQYLQAAAPTPQNSDVAATLYSVLIDLLRSPEDAYQFMDQYGEKFRQSIRARRFDGWYLRTAREQKNLVGMARRLALVLNEQLPLEEERLLYWDLLDGLLDDLSYARPEHFAAAPFCQKIAGLIRENPPRTGRAKFIAAWLAFRAAGVGKEPSAMDQAFAPVAAAARAYLDASPKETTLKEILMVLGGGLQRMDDAIWDPQSAQKREVFVYGYKKLTDPERESMLPWQLAGYMYYRMATWDQWIELGQQFPQVFQKSPFTPNLPFVYVATNPAIYKAETAFLQGVPGIYAGVINAMAASDDLWTSAQYLMKNESWYPAIPDLYTGFATWMWSAYSRYPRDPAHPLPPDYWPTLLARFGAEYTAPTPIALLHPPAASDYIVYAWRNGGKTPGDKSKMVGVLHSLDWVPYTAEQRKEIFGASLIEYRRWVEVLRAQETEAKKNLATLTQSLENGRKEREKLVNSIGENKKAADETKKAQTETAAALEQARTAFVTATKAQTEGQTALKKAQAAKDQNGIQIISAQLPALTKNVADLTAQVAQLEKTAKELAPKAQQLAQAAPPLAQQLQDLDKAIPVQTKKVADADQAVKDLAPSVAWIAPIGEAFTAVMSPSVTDLSKAPNPLCQNLARAALAIQTKKLAQYLEAARAVYPMVRDFDAKKTPFGGAILQWLVTNHGTHFDTFDFQCDVLADQLTRCDPKGPNRTFQMVLATTIAGRPDWSWGNWPGKAKGKILRLNDIFAKGLRDELATNQFWPQLFYWFRMTRGGANWSDPSRNDDVFATMIEKKTLLQTTERIVYNTATCDYLWLLVNNFPKLKAKYPPASYFDDLAIQELRQKGFLDPWFFNYSQDADHKVYDAIARVVQSWEKLPLGYDGGKIALGRDQILSMEYWALSAEDGVRNAMLDQVESTYGKTRWDEYAMGRWRFGGLNSNGSGLRKAYLDKFAGFLDRAQNVPDRVGPPNLRNFPFSPPTNTPPAELDLLLKVFTHTNPWVWPGGWGMETMANDVHETLVAQGRTKELFDLAPQFWRIARDCNNGDEWRRLSAYGGSLMETNLYDLAAVYGTIGLDMLSANPSMPEDVRNALLAIRSKSLSALGSALPVDRADRRYPVFAAQAAYASGKYENAWELYQPHRALVLEMFKELNPAFTIWLIDRHADLAQYDEADALAKALIQWVESAPQGFDPEVRARLMVSYAGISFARQEYPRARAQFEQIALAKEFDGTQGKRDAELKVAEVDRLTKHYDQAIEQLERLVRRRDVYLQAQGNYQLAQIKFDQEEYPEARKYLEQVFAVEPRHAGARILEGRLYLRMKKLVEATEVKVGLASNQETIVPGKPLKVQLEDRNLAVVGQSANIEIRVWTDSGDEELFNLLPFGDSKTKFEGQIPTALAAARRGDHVLQVLGGDVVHYDYSDRFKQANQIARAEPAAIAVVSDAELYVSSGKIYTRDEQDERALERLIRARLPADSTAAPGVSLSTVRPEDEIKPGNKINVRVVDPDRSTTSHRDQVQVRLSTSSGDRIDHFALTETGEHTGVFEGQVPTASAPATAFASDSEESREPNYVISAGEYPHWTALPDNQRPKIFSMDLNRRVLLGRMKLVADVTGRHLRRFVLQTSVNGREFETVGGWPVAVPPWDGAPRMELVRFGDNNRAPATLAEFEQYLQVGYAVDGHEKVWISPAPLAIDWDAHVAGQDQKLKLTSENGGSWYLGHLAAAFHLPQRQVRTFRVDPRGRLENFRYFLTVDGRMGTDPLEVSQSLGKGVHRLDLYFGAARRAKPAFELQCDVPEPPYMAACPADLFDPARHPEIAAAVAFQPARILSDLDAARQQEVTARSLAEARLAREKTAKAQADAQAASKAAPAGKDPAAEAATAKRLDDLARQARDQDGAIQALVQEGAAQAAIVSGDPAPAADGTTNRFYVAFATNSSARVLRLWITDFESDAPALKKIYLTDARGAPVLPTADDLVKLKQNGTLEIVPGDRISVVYEDPKFVTKENQVSEAFLSATFHNATLSACFTESIVDGHGNRRAQYIPLRRFQAGDAVTVFINDPDRDVTDGRDQVKFTARSAEGRPVELDALETEEHSGVFIGKVFPVPGPPQRPSEITVGKGDDLVLGYLDAENTDPGIPWNRVYTLEQTTGMVPDLRVYDVTSRPLTPGEQKSIPANTDARLLEEQVPVTRTIVAARPSEPRPADRPAAGLMGAPLIVELVYPTVAQSPLSKAVLYVQTAAGRKKYGKPPAGDFDVNVPGTIRLERFPGDVGALPAPPGYRGVLVRGNPHAGNPLDDGRFTFVVPMKLGEVPDQSLAFESGDRKTAHAPDRSGRDADRTAVVFNVPYVDPNGETRWIGQSFDVPTLHVRGDDEVFVGFPYQNEAGATNWITRRVKLAGDAFFDVMDRRYQVPRTAVHVGEEVYFRVIDAARDVSDAKDEIPLTVTATSGATNTVKLTETFPHSGVFKGIVPLVFAGDRARASEPGALSTRYGDTVRADYRVADPPSTLTQTIRVYRGANGSVLPFTKRFKDPEIAVQTQFTIAEAYFEMAKKHRELQQETLARREIGQGKKLLEEAIRDYPTTEARAQADYLLADLSLEFANDAADADARQKFYLEAVTRFTDVVASYPDSVYAPKAQFKKAFVFEKMGQIDQACEEYVKLSYRYPDNELVAETIARLGQYYLTKGKEFQDRAGTATDPVEREKIRLQARDMFKTAAQVFGRLAQRFPDHRLAGKTTVLSAQCYMRAEDLAKAIEVFQKVMTETRNEPDLIAQAMYWCGDCYLKQNDPPGAYHVFKKLTWDYPESQWAKYARGRLTEDKLAGEEKKDSAGTN